MGELETGRGLNQELGPNRAGDTRWGSHFKSLLNTAVVFHSIIEVIDAIATTGDQDIVNAISLLDTAKKRLQRMRESGFETLIKVVDAFCKKQDIMIPKLGDIHILRGKSKRRVSEVTNEHYYRVNVLYTVVDMQLQELNSRFNEVNTDLLLGMACLNPLESFSNFDKSKLLHMAKLYPDDFDGDG
ncbi:uncharacterized protein, partial [Rutidosis leptorrhynchoides]|uniref:uncharacterized protein n=1 Tax=Rutidosis leptorrhynchoides TaxID=125765 RepID=UPI003A999A17